MQKNYQIIMSENEVKSKETLEIAEKIEEK